MPKRNTRPSAQQKQGSFDSSDNEKKITASSEALSIHEIPPLAAPLDHSIKGLEFQGLLSIFRHERIDLDAVATRPSVFDDPNTLQAFIPPKRYENAHRFDPLARWTWREEKVCQRMRPPEC
jgi:hypothetical protein